MRLYRTILAAALAAAIIVPTASQPARADGAASTRNIILGAAALVAGIAIESNVAHKQRLANTLVGYLPDGSPVYADGHVVLPNGQTYYPGNYGQTIACSAQACQITGGNRNAPYYGNNGYGPYYGNNGYGPYNNGYQYTRYGQNSDDREDRAEANANVAHNRGNHYGWYQNGKAAYADDSQAAWARYNQGRDH